MALVGVVTGAARGMGAACAARLAGTVDALLLVDRDEVSVTEAAKALPDGDHSAEVEPVGLDVTDRDALDRLATRVSELGTLGPVVHAAGISPTMADWKQVLTVDLVGSVLLVEALRPLATAGTAIVCFASIAPHLIPDDRDPAAEAALGDPLAPDLLDRLRDALGEAIEDPGMAYAWAKRGVHRLVQREAVQLGPVGARICSVSPGIIDTPMSQQEAEAGPVIDALVERTPLARQGDPDEVAAVVAFLLSGEASFVNGIDVPVDGGVVAALRT